MAGSAGLGPAGLSRPEALVGLAFLIVTLVFPFLKLSTGKVIGMKYIGIYDLVPAALKDYRFLGTYTKMGFL